jgi:hypothetical protein
MELVDLFGMPRADVPETHMLANASRACDDGIPPATTGSGTTNNALAAMQNATAGRFFTRRVFTLRDHAAADGVGGTQSEPRSERGGAPKLRDIGTDLAHNGVSGKYADARYGCKSHSEDPAESPSAASPDHKYTLPSG